MQASLSIDYSLTWDGFVVILVPFGPNLFADDFVRSFFTSTAFE